MSITISRTELARRTREAVESARSGETVFIESYGTEQAALIDAKEYHLLRALALSRSGPDTPASNPVVDPRGVTEDEIQARVIAGGGDLQEAYNIVIEGYLNGDVSLGRAAELLGMSRFELQMRFNRLGLPAGPGAFSLNEAKAEYAALQTDDQG